MLLYMKQRNLSRGGWRRLQVGGLENTYGENDQKIWRNCERTNLKEQQVEMLVREKSRSVWGSKKVAMKSHDARRETGGRIQADGFKAAI